MAPSTADRLRRLLAILAWLAQVEEAPIEETAQRFDLSSEELVTELEMAACCGVPPYTPDQLMEIVVTEETVSVRVGTSLSRPRRLSPSEGFALATSARALLAVPGSDADGALSRALAKLDRALGGEGIEVELDAPPLLPQVREALADRRLLHISYYSASTDRVSERDIAPLRLFASAGHWYVDAWCRTAGGLRRFRVDRIGAAEELDAGFPPEAQLPADGPEAPDTPDRSGAVGPPDGADGGDGGDGGTEAGGGPSGGPGGSHAGPGGGPGLYVPGPDSQRVRLSLDPAAAWLVESIPAAGPPTPVGDRIEVELFVGGDAWLERLLLRLGPGTRVIDPPEYRSLGAEAAARVLRRYGREQQRNA